MKAKAGGGSNYETKKRSNLRKNISEAISAAATADAKGYKRRVNVTSATGAEGPKKSVKGPVRGGGAKKDVVKATAWNKAAAKKKRSK